MTEDEARLIAEIVEENKRLTAQRDALAYACYRYRAKLSRSKERRKRAASKWTWQPGMPVNYLLVHSEIMRAMNGELDSNKTSSTRGRPSNPQRREHLQGLWEIFCDWRARHKTDTDTIEALAGDYVSFSGKSRYCNEVKKLKGDIKEAIKQFKKKSRSE